MSKSKSKSSASAGKSKKQSSEQETPKKETVNWHEAASCAVEIDLRDYSHMLEFMTEYHLKDGNYRIDLILIKKLTNEQIPKNIAMIFSTLNIFEIKGLGSSVSTDSYYKTIGYAGLLIDQMGGTGEYINTDVSISFLCMHYPRNLIKHLTEERHLTVEKSASGVYYISKEIFNAQIIVTHMLSPDDSLYLCCLTDKLSDDALIDRLVADYTAHREQVVYTKYLNQLTTANIREGGNTMVCEGLLNLFGTSSDEITEKAMKKADAYYLPKIEALTAENEQKINALSSKVDYKTS